MSKEYDKNKRSDGNCGRRTQSRKTHPTGSKGTIANISGANIAGHPQSSVELWDLILARWSECG